ncbi:MAG: preprotein translocase subunit SecE, partial [Vicinamibacterales bacterium]
MATQQTVEDVTSTGDRLKLALAVVVVIAGIVGFYAFAQQPTVVRILSVIGGLVLGGLIAWTSDPGRRLIAFGRESWSETKRVVWPTKKETWTITLYVFLFVVVMALFLWLVDKSL